MLVAKKDILNYIPHRQPFVLIDSLISATSEIFESEFFIDPNHLLVANGVFQESGLMENIAQTCAAGFGYLDRENNSSPKTGFIGAITKAEVFELPASGTTVRTTVTTLHQLGNIFLVKGLNSAEGRKLLECEMKIVVG